jgi:hypothetical protein
VEGTDCHCCRVAGGVVYADGGYPWKLAWDKGGGYSGGLWRRRLRLRYSTRDRSGVRCEERWEGTKAGSRPLRANTALMFAMLDSNVAIVPTYLSWNKYLEYLMFELRLFEDECLV